MEMHLGGANGFSMNLGQGGTDISYQALQGVAAGLSVWDENAKINARAAALMSGPNGIKENLDVGLRSIASGVDANSTALYASIMNGSTKFKDDSSLNAVAETVANQDGSKTISFGNKTLGNGLFDNSVLLAHEAMRNGVWDGTDAQTQETNAAAMNHMGMASAIQANYTGGLSSGLAMEAQAYNAFKAGAISKDQMEQYVKGNYSSAGDYWKLEKVIGPDGAAHSKISWDNSLDLNIVGADGKITKVDASKISSQGGLNTVQQWFNANGLGDQWNANLSGVIVKIGDVSVDTQALIDSVANKGAGFREARSNFIGSVNDLLGSGLEIGGLGAIPDQNQKYPLIEGNATRTTLFGERIKAPAISSIQGILYSLGSIKHNAEDFTGASTNLTNPLASKIGMSWSDGLGFQMTMDFGGGNSLQNNHLAPASVMNLLPAMLTSNSVANILAGVTVANMGATGSNTSPDAIHDHLVANAGTIAPSTLFATLDIPQKYHNEDVLLTGLPSGIAYDDPGLLAQIQSYSQAHKDFSKQAYVDAHSDLFKPKSGVGGSVFLMSKFDVKTMTWKNTY